MPQLKPFRGIRPAEGLAERISALPYDVMNRAEAKEMGADPLSFLHISRAEIDLDDSVDPYDPLVCETARKNLYRMLDEGSLLRDPCPCFYVYREIMHGRAQTGLVGCASIDDYVSDRIKKHELTRVEKEIDRINHFDACDAHTEPVFLTYRKNAPLSALTERLAGETAPAYDFTGNDGIRHMLWVVSDSESIAAFESEFKKIDAFYIADGHHRSASSVKVGMKRRAAAQNPTGEEAFNFFLAVLFPAEDLAILPYNRVVKDLAGLSREAFLEKVGARFDIETANGPYAPQRRHEIGMYLDGRWYVLRCKDHADGGDVVANLDISILQNELLGPILGIEDPRTDKRIDFVGGIRGLSELEKRGNLDMKVAFSMYATTVDELLAVADAGKIMPPKSTWFEPKLRSGLFVHSFGKEERQ
jgi:uncharacterized protein (DUF1015 family)